ncbi:MAG: Rieske (2Fe-2S) protein [Alphaproteobacteria bacterium]
MAQEHICAADDIPEMEARGFVGRIDGMQRNIFAVRRDGALHLYLNKCPHAGALLDHIQGQFFTPDGSHLRCGMHGAIFRIESGECIDGPCQGANLTRLAFVERDNEIYLTGTIAE